MALKASKADAIDRAQALIYDAWEIDDPERQVAMAREALAISPLCADAFVILAGCAEPGSDEQLDLWRRGVAAGKDAIGEPEFEQMTGDFWGFLETRPYMRARCGLAQALWDRGHQDEAIEHLRDMLVLNPNDNQGIRYLLLSFLLETGRDDDASALLRDYADDGAADWTWSAALASFRRAGDARESRALLVEALSSNRHVAAYLLGRRRLPKQLPPFVGVGDQGEAAYYVKRNLAVWSKTPNALDWLRSQVPAPSKGKRPQ